MERAAAVSQSGYDYHTRPKTRSPVDDTACAAGLSTLNAVFPFLVLLSLLREYVKVVEGTGATNT